MKQNKRLTDAEILEAFPEAKPIIQQKLREAKHERKALVDDITDKLQTINTDSDEMTRWFWRKWLKLTAGEDLLVIDRRIARLNRQLRVYKGLPSNGALTDDVIQAAQAVPIEDILDQSFRRSGRNLVGLCPLHQERTPSFHIYVKENRGWCFGCNRGGDAIAITMLVYGYSFKEAVKFLAGGMR